MSVYSGPSASVCVRVSRPVPGETIALSLETTMALNRPKHRVSVEGVCVNEWCERRGGNRERDGAAYIVHVHNLIVVS